MGHPPLIARRRGKYRLSASGVRCAKMFRLRAVPSLLALVVSSALPVRAQDTSCLHRTLPITVHDPHGLQFRGLTAADFQAKFRGQPVKILSIHPDTRPHRIVILLDTSGSMLGESAGQEWKITSAIAAHIGQSGLRNTSYALLLFSDKVHEQIDFSQGNSAVANRLLDIWSDPSYAKKNVRGTTALLDTILSAVRLLGVSGSSDSIYVISDGGDNRSRSHLQDVRNALVTAGVRLHVTLLGPEIPLYAHLPQESESAEGLLDLVDDSGGLIVGPLGLGNSGYNLAESQRRVLAARLFLMYRGMTANDLVDIELPQSVDKWRKWSLELSPKIKKLYKDLWIAYPHELAPCSALSQ
jgi:hypothetical protein